MTLFVGAARAGAATQGGLFRQTGRDWERLAGVPDAVHAITVHPRDPGCVFVATADGIYRSKTANGPRPIWHRLDTPHGIEVWSIAVHPNDPRILYAGTSPVGVMRSDDGGEHWRDLPGAHLAERVKMAFVCRVMRIAIDPVNPDHLYCALEVGGVMRSLDGGATWADCAPALARFADEVPHLRSMLQSDTETEGMLDAHALAVSAARPGAVVLAVRMGLFESIDRGTAWRDMAVGRFSPLTYARDVRVSPHDPRRLFACLSPASRSFDGSLVQSDDLGVTWRRIDHGVKAERTMMALALDPRDPATVHCVSRNGQVFTTADAGRSWSETRLRAPVEDVYAIAAA